MQEEQSATQRQAEQRYVERPGVVRERWDCESVLSLRSNLDNHPASISQPPSSRRLRQQVIMTILMTVLLLHFLMTSNLSCPEEQAKTRAQSFKSKTVRIRTGVACRSLTSALHVLAA